MMLKPLKLSMHCSCGASVVAKVNEVQTADQMLQLFNQLHSGPGHAPSPPRLGRVPPNRLPRERATRELV